MTRRKIDKIKIVSYDTKMQSPITEREYHAFQVAYDFFNAELFAGTLPHVLVTLQRKANAKGYFSPDRFEGRSEKVTAHELAMNPDVFTGRTDEEICSTLAHEMAHVWQQTHGTPSRGGYHNKQWAAKMKEIGLYPSDTGEPTGKETGQHMTHYIVRGGPYQTAFTRLAGSGFRLNWQSHDYRTALGGTGVAGGGMVVGKAGVDRKKKAASKTKYTCPQCGANAWAKPQTLLICGACHKNHDGKGLVTMEPEESAEAETAK